MYISHGQGKSQFGPGVSIELSGNEVATAIMAYLVSQGVTINGPRTVFVNDELCTYGEVYIDPSGSVIHETSTGSIELSGRG